MSSEKFVKQGRPVRALYSFLAALLFIALLSTGGPSPAVAAAGVAAAQAGAAEKAAGLPIKIAPHRAIYEMKLASVKNGSNITGVSGRMLFEWADVCDGWAVQQNLKLHFDYAEGDSSDVSSSVVSWESKDGTRYNFYVRRVSDGKVTDVFRGKATMGPGGGEVIYSIPAGKAIKLPAGTLFPSAHTELLVREALAGKRLFMRRVFDGSDAEGMDDISAFIGREQGHIEATEMNPKLKDNPLLEQPAWPIRMAFFKVNSETGEPDYEMNLDLLANGVARRMLLDYGDFAVVGVLTHLESVPVPPGCKG